MLQRKDDQFDPIDASRPKLSLKYISLAYLFKFLINNGNQFHHVITLTINFFVQQYEKHWIRTFDHQLYVS